MAAGRTMPKALQQVSAQPEQEHYRPAAVNDQPTSNPGSTQSNIISTEKLLDQRTPQDHDPNMSLAREVCLITVICASQFLTQVGLAQSIAPLRVIGLSFGTTDAGELAWMPAAYSLTVGCFILPAGRWGDLYGHKILFMFGYAWFSLWSFAAGFSVWSRSMVLFDVFRAMQGIGPAILLPNGIAILARSYPPGRRKDIVLSIFGAAAPTGFVVGAVFSGIFTELAWWPWTYWALGIALGVLAVSVIFIVPQEPALQTRHATAELDLTGTFLGVIGLVLFNFAWNEGPSVGWDQPYVYSLLVVGTIVLGTFFYFEFRKAAHPLLPACAFTLDTNLVFGCIAAGWASFGVWIFYLWQIFGDIRGDSILQSAAEMTPAAISGAIAAIATGFLIGKLQPGIIMAISMLCFCVGIVLVATNPADRTYWAQLFLSPIVASWGMDMSFPAGVIVLSNHMPREQQGIAASLVNTVVNYSISIGIGMAGTVERYVRQGGADSLAGYRSALYFAIGLDVLGFILALGLTLSWRNTVKTGEKSRSKQLEIV